MWLHLVSPFLIYHPTPELTTAPVLHSESTTTAHDPSYPRRHCEDLDTIPHLAPNFILLVPISIHQDGELPRDDQNRERKPVLRLTPP